MRELRSVVQQQQCKMAELQTELAEHKLQLQTQQQEIHRLKVGAPEKPLRVV